MARRRKPFMDDGDDDSPCSSDASSGGERSWSRKRKRGNNGKDNAIYGSFLDSDQDQHASQPKGRALKPLTFVPSTSKHMMRGEDDGDDDKGDGGEDDEEDDGEDSHDNDSDGNSTQHKQEDDEYSEAEEFARKPVTETELNEVRIGFDRSGPTYEEQNLRTGLGARAGIGSRKQNDPSQDVRDDSYDDLIPNRQGLGLTSRTGIGATSHSNNNVNRSGIGSLSSFAAASNTSSRPSKATSLFGFVASTTNMAKSPPPSSTIPPSPPLPPTPPPPPSAATANQPTEPSSVSSPFSSLPTEFASVTPSDAFKKQRPLPPTQADTSSSQASYSVPKTNIKFGGKFDPASYLASMGWTGGGLGARGEGIVVPVEVQLRPERAGLAYGGRKEKTKQARDDARRRGEAVSFDDDDDNDRKRSHRSKPKSKTKDQAKQQPKKKEDWKKPPTERKPRKPKIEHRTYEQILAEIGVDGAASTVQDKVIDAATGREFSSVSEALRSQVGDSVSRRKRLPELRHNLRLVCDGTARTLRMLAQEGGRIVDRRKWLTREAEEARRKRDRDLKEADRVRKVLAILHEIEQAQARNGGVGEERNPLDVFDPVIARLLDEFTQEMVEYHLDEAVVAAIAPVLKRIWAEWDPLTDPEATISHLTRWIAVLRLGDNNNSKPNLSDPSSSSSVMSAYESLLWTVWMPKLRSCLNNDWKPTRAGLAVTLISVWKPILPRFILDNIVDQLILPKLETAVSDWDPKQRRIDLHHIVFPWLAILPTHQLNQVISDSRRRYRSFLQTHSLDNTDTLTVSLSAWRQFLSPSEWNSLILSSLVPRLSSHLATNLIINPVNQDLTILNTVLSLFQFLSKRICLSILHSQFFPKWINVLYLWLIQQDANLNQIADWYLFWKTYFHQQQVKLESIIGFGFHVALDLINSGLSVSDRSKLIQPDFTLLQDQRQHPKNKKEKEKPNIVEFEQILQDYSDLHDLILFNHGIDQVTGRKLFRLNSIKNKKKSFPFSFFLDTKNDVIWVNNSPISIDDLFQLVIGEEEEQG